jgi:Flp pilus assembly protein TadB
MALLVAVLTWGAVWHWMAATSPIDRLRAIRVAASGSPRSFEEKGEGDRSPARLSPMREILLAIVAGGLGFVLVGGLAGIVVAVVGAGGTFYILRTRPPAAARRTTTRLIADLPFAVDLLVACLRAGQPLSSSVEVTAIAMGGPIGHRLSRVSGQLKLGADAVEAWSPLAHEPALAQLATTMIRAAATGSPVADVLTRLADDAADAARAASSAGARRAGVQAVAPLGLCFLPAFVLLGIIPVVAGLADQVLIT